MVQWNHIQPLVRYLVGLSDTMYTLLAGCIQWRHRDGAVEPCTPPSEIVSMICDGGGGGGLQNIDCCTELMTDP